MHERTEQEDWSGQDVYELSSLACGSAGVGRRREVRGCLGGRLGERRGNPERLRLMGRLMISASKTCRHGDWSDQGREDAWMCARWTSRSRATS